MCVFSYELATYALACNCVRLPQPLALCHTNAMSSIFRNLCRSQATSSISKLVNSAVALVYLDILRTDLGLLYLYLRYDLAQRLASGILQKRVYRSGGYIVWVRRVDSREYMLVLLLMHPESKALNSGSRRVKSLCGCIRTGSAPDIKD